MTARNPVIRRARPAAKPPRGTVGTLNITDSILPSYLAEKTATAVPSGYPSGFSVMSITSDTSWPLGVTDGLVETWITGAGAAGYRIKQTYTGQGGYLVFHRFAASSDTWESWQLATPYANFASTTTQYDIVTATTWETAMTLTVAALPSTRFDARVIGSIGCWSRNTTVGGVQTRIRVSISLDGGTSYNTGREKITTGTDVNNFTAISARHQANGSITGDIKVRLEGYSSHADTYLDDLYADVQIVGNH